MDMGAFAIQGLSIYGVKFESTNSFTESGKRIIKISVPEFSELKNVNVEYMAGEVLAKRAREIIKDARFDVVLMRRIRKNEHWTKENSKAAENALINAYSSSRESIIFDSL